MLGLVKDGVKFTLSGFQKDKLRSARKGSGDECEGVSLVSSEGGVAFVEPPLSTRGPAGAADWAPHERDQFAEYLAARASNSVAIKGDSSSRPRRGTSAAAAVACPPQTQHASPHVDLLSEFAAPSVAGIPGSSHEQPPFRYNGGGGGSTHNNEALADAAATGDGDSGVGDLLSWETNFGCETSNQLID